MLNKLKMSLKNINYKLFFALLAMGYINWTTKKFYYIMNVERWCFMWMCYSVTIFLKSRKS